MTTSQRPRDASADVPKEISLHVDVTKLYQRNRQFLGSNPEQLFPQGEPQGLYDRTLMGVPFVITSLPMFRTQDGRFGRQEVAQVWCKLINVDTGTPGESQLARFNGRYILNQLRSIPEDELVGAYIWTVAYNPAMPRTTGDNYPRMLKIYEHGVDTPEGETEEYSSPFEANGVQASAPFGTPRAPETAAREVAAAEQAAYPLQTTIWGDEGTAPIKRPRGRPRKNP